MMLVPDELHRQVWESDVRDGVAPGNLLLFGHGFSVLYGEVEAPEGVDVALAAPKGPGHLVRRQYLEGSAFPASSRSTRTRREGEGPRAGLRARHRLHARRRLRDDVQGRDGDGPLRGAGRALRRRLGARAGGFDTLVEAGYPPEMAYFECLHELKLIVDLMYEKGLAGMRYSISNTAEYGDYTAAPGS
jgi:ketol-acid reductoisomerase